MKFEEMIADLRQAAAGINRIANSQGLQAGADSLGQVMDNANETLDEVRTAVKKVEELSGDLKTTLAVTQKELSTATAEARRTLETATASLHNVRSLTRPEAPLVQELTTTLKDVAQAARQLSNFLDYLERNPSALVRGKSTSDEK